MKLTRSLEDYLETILVLELNNEHPHTSLIAKKLKVSKPAVTKALKHLAKRGLVTKTSYEDVAFTREGRSAAKSIYHRHNTIKEFLEYIGVNKEVAERDCCKIEHVISNETLKAFAKVIKK